MSCWPLRPMTAFLGLPGGHVTARDYYEASAPPLRSSTPNGGVFSPRPGWLPGRNRRSRRMVPTFTRSSVGQGGAQLYSGSIATATPQAFTVASPPLELDGLDRPHLGGVVHCTPAHIRQVGARLRLRSVQHWFAYAALLTLLDEPAPSGSTRTARLLGTCHRSPSFPAIGCPDASSGRCDGPTATVSHHLPIHLAPRGAQLRARRKSRPPSGSRWLSEVVGTV